MKLRIEKAVYGGSGLARMPEEPASLSGGEPAMAGKTVFVPYVLPGELVEAHVTVERRSFSNAALDSVLEPAPERVSPNCEYFPACGGCQYQHASAGYQLRMKLDIFRDTLNRARLAPHLSGLEAPGSIGCLEGPPWAYRNRIRLRVVQTGGARRRADAADGLALCYRERGTHTGVPIAHCPIAAPLLERAVAAVSRIGKEAGLAGLCHEIELFTNGEEDALLVSLWAGHSRPACARLSAAERQTALDSFSKRLKEDLPQLTGVGLFVAGERSPVLIAQWGRRSLFYSVAGHRYQVSLGSFFQVNRFLLPQFLQLVAGHRAGGLAWDLYAGSGFFSLGLAFDRVIAVEAAPFSAADLKQNLSGAGRRAVQSTALDFLRSQAAGGPGNRPGLIVLDPPRAGLGKEVCAHLIGIAAPELVYVSCDPATLARDLQALLQFSYRLRSLHLVDLFPQTFHLETVAVLTRE